MQAIAASKPYFRPNLDVYVGLICEEPPFEGFHKPRRPRLRRTRDASGNVTNYAFTYEIAIPYASVGEQDLVQLTKRGFLDSLTFFDKIKAFDTKPFQKDVFDAVVAYQHEPIYLSEQRVPP
ncbi:hypothetical protein [Hymenobacter terrestris]|uniref:Uncharacterized protein n=1 Tax=Hymenobacter terrestris TaxID=2748310 RepID=A0ABX2Q9T7_9BACT|nr:hypothetical protein [Hymenobacter terrestris]NVO86731.1 hypothetical protein [Hymenobacter terrestris]